MRSYYRILYRLAVVAVGIAGIVLQMIQAQSAITMLSFYTVQSNAVCVAMFAVLVILEMRGRVPQGRKYSYIKGLVTAGIMLTFAVFHFMLRPNIIELGEEALYYMDGLPNTIVHYVVPLTTLMDYVLFDKKGCYRWRYPFLWTVMPIGYLAYTVVYRLCGGLYFLNGTVIRFPYFFLDYETYGWTAVLLWFVALYLVYVAFSYIIVVLDKLLATIKIKNKT